MPHNSYFHRSQMLLNIIHHLGPISRTELVELTDWRPASVGDIIRELLEKQLIIETGHFGIDVAHQYISKRHVNKVFFSHNGRIVRCTIIN